MNIVERHTLQLTPRIWVQYQRTREKHTISRLSVEIPFGACQASPGQAWATAIYLQLLFPYSRRPEVVLTSDRTQFHFWGTLSDIIDAAATLFSGEDFKNHQRLKQVQEFLLAQYDQQQHEVTALLESHLTALAFAGTPYAWELTGQPEQIENMTPGALAHIYQTVYCQACTHWRVVTAEPVYPLWQSLKHSALMDNVAPATYIQEMRPLLLETGFQQRLLEKKTESGWGALGFRLRGWEPSLVLYQLLQTGWHQSPDPRFYGLSLHVKRMGIYALLYAVFPLSQPEQTDQEFIILMEWFMRIQARLDARLVRQAIDSCMQVTDEWQWEGQTNKIQTIEPNDIRRLFFQYLNADHAAVVKLLPMLSQVHASSQILQALKQWERPALPRTNPYLIKGAATQMPFSQQQIILCLRNGISLEILPDSSRKMVSLGAWTPYGSTSDPQSGSGTTALLFALLKQACSRLLQTPFSSLATVCHFDFGVEREYSWFRIDIPASHLRDGLALLQKMLTLSPFPWDAYDRARRQLLSQLNKSHFSPLAFAREQFFNAVFSNHPYAHMPQGRRHEVLQITDEAVYLQYQEIFSPEKLHLLVTGACPAILTQEVADSYFGDLESQLQRPLSWIPPERERPLSPRRGAIVLKTDIERPVHVSGCLYPEPPTPEHMARFLLLQQALLNQSPYHTLYSQNECHGIFYHAYSKCQLLYIQGIGLERPETELQELFAALDLTAIPPLARQAQLSRQLRLEHVSSLWNTWIGWRALGLKPDAFESFPDMLQMVEPQGVQELTQTMTHFNEWTHVILK